MDPSKVREMVAQAQQMAMRRSMQTAEMLQKAKDQANDSHLKVVGELPQHLRPQANPDRFFATT